MNAPAAALVLALALLAAGPAGAGPVELGDDINARLARAKSQQAAAAERPRIGGTAGGVTAIGGSAAGAAGNGCNIAIGNIFEDKSRIGSLARRETTVIVTGDVIQVGNHCR